MFWKEKTDLKKSGSAVEQEEADIMINLVGIYLKEVIHIYPDKEQDTSAQTIASV